MSYFNIHDTMLQPVSFNEISLMLQNTRPEDMLRFREEVRKMLMDHVEDAMYEMDTHWDEIWADAHPDEREELVNAPGWDSERLEALAWEIHNFLRERELWIDISIYYDGKRMSTSRKVDGKYESRYNGEPFIEEGYDPRDYFEYVQNPHIASLSFEGPFYDVVNYTSGKVLDDFEKLLRKHGLYMELGNCWNCSLAEVDS